MAIMYVTPAGAGAKDGSSWSAAFGEAEFEADLEGAAEATDIYYVQAGTYTLDSSYDATARDGTAIGPISIIGVKAATTNEPPVFTDWGSGDDRPTFACGASYQVSLGDYYKVFNCIFTGASTNVLLTAVVNVLYNCKSTNSSGTSGRAALNIGSNSAAISCEGISTNGICLALGAAGRAIFNYLHDASSGSGVGIALAGSAVMLHNVIDTCITGIDVASDDIVTYFNNSIYNCTTAVSATDSIGNVAINNLIDTCSGDAFKWTTQTDINFFAYNHGNDTRNTDQWDTVATALPHGEIGGGSAGAASAFSGGDPHFTDEANGDFSLETDSPCLDAGMALTLGCG